MAVLLIESALSKVLKLQLYSFMGPSERPIFGLGENGDVCPGAVSHTHLRLHLAFAF